MNEITYEEVKIFLLETDFDWLPGQNEISFPVIQRIHRRLQQDNTFSAIKIREGRIVDGHHRYICHKLLGLDPKTTIGGANSVNQEYIWVKMNLSMEDYDSDEDKAKYEQRYDKQ